MASRLQAGLIGLAALALVLPVGVGLWSQVARQQGSDLKVADRYFVHAAPLHLNQSWSDTSNQWQASATCGNSEQPIRLRNAANFRPARPDALKRAAQSLESRLGGSGEDGQTENNLAQAVRQWPTEQIWVNVSSGTLMALGNSGHHACLLMTTVPL